MLAGVYNMTCEQGSTFIRNLEIERPDPSDPTGQTFIPFDLSGYEARMQVRRTMESSATMIDLTSEVDEDGNGITMQPLGEVHAMKIYMTDELTATISTSGVYDIEIINSIGEVSRVLQGQFTLNPEVTR